MNAIPTETTGIPEDLKAKLRGALDRLARGIRDKNAAKEACERMDRMREANREQFGEQNVAVGLIRQIRDSQ